MLWNCKKIRARVKKLIHNAEIQHKEYVNQLPSCPSLKFTLIAIESKKSLQEFQTLLSNTQLNTCQELTTQLALLLNKRWERIQGSCLSYTALSERDRSGYIQVLCLETARLLSKTSPEKGVYRYLMPSLLGETADVLTLQKGNINQYRLEECILDEAGHYLLPVYEIAYNYYQQSSVLYHPFTGNPLSSQEITRLWQHSNITAFLINLLTQLGEEEIKPISLGGHVHALIQALRKGSACSSSEEAGPAALVGLVNFTVDWDTFSEEDRSYAYRCTDNFGYNLKQILSILTKEDKNTFDCVEYFSFALEGILKRHPKLYWIGNTKENIQSICSLLKLIENLYYLLNMQPSGTDKLPVLTPVLCELFHENIQAYGVTSFDTMPPSHSTLEALYHAEMTLHHHHAHLLNLHTTSSQYRASYFKATCFFCHCRSKSQLPIEISISQKLIDFFRGIHSDFTPQETQALLELSYLRSVLAQYTDLVPEFKDILNLNSPFKLKIRENFRESEGYLSTPF